MERTGIREITAEEVRDFLKANTKGDECLSCGTGDWLLDGGSHGLFRTHVWGRPIEGKAVAEIVSSGIPQFTLTCTNCGFVRIHDIYVINAWLRVREEFSK